MKKASNTQEMEIAAAPVIMASAEDEDIDFASLGASLTEIRKLKGVSGFILRGSTSAIVDLAEPDKMVQYALWSHQLFERSLEIAKQSNIATVESVLLEAEKMKVLYMSIGENQVCVLMDKNANHSWIIKKIFT